MIYRVLCPNSQVTDFYMDIIKKCYEKNDMKVIDKQINDIKATQGDIIICARILDAIKLIQKNRKSKIVFWVQGIEPEESYLQHNSKIRKLVLNLLERHVLLKADFLFFVSEKMKSYLETKHNITFTKEKFHIMPCFNTSIQTNAFFCHDKYEKNNFVYVGSLSKWQKFGETIDLFKSIKNNSLKDAELYVYTFDVELAKTILNKKNVLAKEVLCLKPEELPEYLSKMKYGFIIRDDNPVNNVATPTKISTYLSCGIIPIYSDYLEGMNDVLRYLTFKNPIRYNETIEFNDCINCKTVYEECKAIFEHIYCADYQIELFQNILITATVKS